MSQSSLNLGRIVLQDILHHKWLVLLGFIVLLNGVAVVITTDATRKLTSKWDVLLQEQDKLDIEWRNLLLEEQSLSEHSRVTRIASKQLNMARPLPKEEIVIRTK
ncbi:cell division protein FtsL [Shewanella sp. WXL01]|uniref:Cell division protein FtsL n=1 Tax=Shewanella maritima TaxID=2520507 RepID=A0A411PJ04_9GAMM|nr:MULTISPECIES: cell division protein FtsL [Shewanella]NKF52357.1 cell division protein FtsL [Shewanella sp. WXL01]QBF83340.1 cell division protein FtsL [Shewanella maritima]